MDTLARWIENENTESEYRAIDTLTHPDATTALRFWARRPQDGIRIGRDVPSRAIARLLSHVVVYTPLKDGSDAVVHLAGTGLRMRFGRDITGLKLSQIFVPEDFNVRLAALKDVIGRGEPRLAEVVHRTGDIEVLRLELLTLPVVAPNGQDRWALAFAFYF
ncbi:PAS domain-containing protein [Rhizomicrobium electricum]|jgi:hypothetical protein|uniref:PAS domain-containing protein n=1 Tax=Rhizomicrobium electricum TaxID=480070 RepID=A0ABN1E3K1_9PROT|nr:PAS domain-containing protein [Rhizomicrobium electricum]NIJ47565.1 hypothetical protein [Rhizomicrobium electricum]